MQGGQSQLRGGMRMMRATLLPPRRSGQAPLRLSTVGHGTPAALAQRQLYPLGQFGSLRIGLAITSTR